MEMVQKFNKQELYLFMKNSCAVRKELMIFERDNSEYASMKKASMIVI